MKQKLINTTKESFNSIMPITAVVFILSISIAPIPAGTLLLFICTSFLLVLGMGLFTMGVDMSLIPIGEDIGIKMTTSKKIIIVIITSFIMGVIITIAEPALQVLAQLFPGVKSSTLILTVSCGVGIFLVLAILRILFRISLSKMLLVLYLLVIILSMFIPNNFVAVAFDSGGVATGPITVPFILAMGLGLASIRGDKDSLEDSFGLVALCCIGPIIAVSLLGIFLQANDSEYASSPMPDIVTSQDMTIEIVRQIPNYILEVARSVWPILAVVAIFQILTRRYHKRQMLRILIGFIYTFIGLVLFLTGVNVGFIPVGQYIGSYIAQMPMKWLLIPLGAIIGYFIVAAEPSVHVLKKQVEDISGGGIPGYAVQRYLSIGTSVSLAISMLRVLTGISIYSFLIPGYITAIVLTFFAPKIFIGIAFDSGGVVTGPMTSTFLLPFAIGACINPDRIMYDAFGLVAIVAMSPLISIQLMGIIYKNKMHQAKNIDLPVSPVDEIIEFKEISSNEV